MAVPAGMLRTLVMAPVDEELQLDVDIFPALHNATGLTRFHWASREVFHLRRRAAHLPISPCTWACPACDC